MGWQGDPLNRFLAIRCNHAVPVVDHSWGPRIVILKVGIKKTPVRSYLVPVVARKLEHVRVVVDIDEVDVLILERELKFAVDGTQLNGGARVQRRHVE